MLKKDKMTAKEKRECKIQAVYDMIRTAYDEHCYPPSIREICIELGVGSTSTVHRYIAELENRGLLVVHHGINRGLQLTERVG